MERGYNKWAKGKVRILKKIGERECMVVGLYHWETTKRNIPKSEKWQAVLISYHIGLGRMERGLGWCRRYPD